jgi:hypothetical protein
MGDTVMSDSSLLESIWREKAKRLVGEPYTPFEDMQWWDWYRYNGRLDERYRELLEEQIDKNYDLITRLEKKKYRRDSWILFRRDLAIYRLHNYYGQSTKFMAEKTNHGNDTIQRAVGRTYKKLCIADEGCVLRFIFEDLEKAT